MKIITQRLLIRPLAAEDNMNMYRILWDFEHSPAKPYDFPRPADIDKINLHIRYWVRSGKYFSIDLKETGETIGFICYEKDEIGFSTISSSHRMGYGYEAVSAFIDFMHTTKKKKHFTAQAAAANTPSVRLLTKLGFSEKSREYVNFRKDEKGNPIPCECINFELEM